MQLIGEPEPVVNMEIDMSSENTANNKNDDNKIVNPDDPNTSKTNGNNDQFKAIERLKRREAKKTLKACHTRISNVPVDIDEYSNVSDDSDDSITYVRPTMNGLKPEESQKDGSKDDVNDLETVENEATNIDENKDVLDDDDYLEDDIISISEEPFKQIPVPEIESLVLEKDEETAKENIEQSATEEDKLDVLKDKSKPLQFEENSSIEVIEGTRIALEPCTTTVEPHLKHQKQNEKDCIHNVESEEQSPTQGEQSSQLPMQMKEYNLKTVEKPINSADQSENPIEPFLKEVDEIEIIDEPASTLVQCENESELVNNTAYNDEKDATVEVEPFITSEKSLELTLEDSKLIGVEITEESKETNTECENKTAVPETDGKHCDQIEVVKETKENSIPLNLIGPVINETTDQCEDTPDPATFQKPVVELIEESKKPAHDENKTNLPTEATDNLMECMEIAIPQIDNSEKTIKTFTTTESVVKESNTNSIDTSVVVNDDSMDVDELVKDVESTIDTPVVVKDDSMVVEEVVKDAESATVSGNSVIELKDYMDAVEETKNTENDCTEVKESTPVNNVPVAVVDKPIICKLSNTLDILSDDEEELLRENSQEEEPPKIESAKLDPPTTPSVNDKQCIDIDDDDDDDIMLIDEDTNKTTTNPPVDTNINHETAVKPDTKTDSETVEKNIQETVDLFETHDKKEKTPPPVVAVKDLDEEINIKEKETEKKIDNATPLPLIPDNFVKTAKSKLSDMTRDELEELCILKIVESIIDRSSLSDIKSKLKSMTQGLEEYRKKATMLSKQTRDLQLVLKSVQEEQKKVMGAMPVTPLKITRSVGMQVYMEKTVLRKKGPPQNANKNPNNAQNKNAIPLGQGPRPQKQVNQSIPVPRLVPANNPTLKTPSTIPQINQNNTTNKNTNQPNGIIKIPTPAKGGKRQHNKIASSSFTVDLTDDEPPTKMLGGPRTSPAPPVRLVPPQNLMGPARQPFGANVNSPRKVYIPISGPQDQALRPGQTIMLKTVPATGIRQRCPTPQVTRVDPNSARMNMIGPRHPASRHPAPLPLATKQYQPPNWKTVPPAPDLKLSKVENGIVISWKIEGVPEDTYEEIASYQLYAYQETSQPPSTTLWKKIGDVKALPLPMACTLTQFMAGFKYYFAVRAVDIRSRVGSFSLPGSILLLTPK